MSPLIVRPNFFLQILVVKKLTKISKYIWYAWTKLFSGKLKCIPVLYYRYRTNFIFIGFNYTTLPLLNYIVSILAFAFCRKSHKTVLKEFLKTVFLYCVPIILSCKTELYNHCVWNRWFIYGLHYFLMQAQKNANFKFCISVTTKPFNWQFYYRTIKKFLYTM